MKMADEQLNPIFEIIRIYNKDISLETPNSPRVFREEWKPESKIDLDVKNEEVDTEHHVYDITLRITVTTKTAESLGSAYVWCGKVMNKVYYK